MGSVLRDSVNFIEVTHRNCILSNQFFSICGIEVPYFRRPISDIGVHCFVNIFMLSEIRRLISRQHVIISLSKSKNGRTPNNFEQFVVLEDVSDIDCS